MNFLVFRDFSRIFLIFNEFIWISFELKKRKNQILLRVDLTADVAQAKRASPCGVRVCVLACEC